MITTYTTKQKLQLIAISPFIVAITFIALGIVVKRYIDGTYRLGRYV